MGQSKLEPGSSMAVLCDLTRWKDPVLSGLVAGSGLLFLGALSCYSLIAVVAYFGLSLVLLGLGSKLYVHLMGLLKKPCKDPLAKVESLNLEVTEEQVQAVLSQVASYANMVAATTKRLLLVEDYLESAKFALVAYLATFLGAIMNSLTLVAIAWVAAFSLPTVYAAKQKEVDAMLATVTAHYTTRNPKLPPKRSRRFAKSGDSCQKLERVKSLNLD